MGTGRAPAAAPPSSISRSTSNLLASATSLPAAAMYIYIYNIYIYYVYIQDTAGVAPSVFVCLCQCRFKNTEAGVALKRQSRRAGRSLSPVDAFNY